VAVGSEPDDGPNGVEQYFANQPTPEAPPAAAETQDAAGAAAAPRRGVREKHGPNRFSPSEGIA